MPPAGGYPGMIPYPMMVPPGWIPYQVDQNGNPIDPGYSEGYYEETGEEDYQEEENNHEQEVKEDV